MPRNHSTFYTPEVADAEYEAPFIEPGKPSKTQLKKVSHDLQTLGLALLELPKHRLAAVPMPERLLDALNELRDIRSHEGRRRQIQYVGKLMRTVDAEPLREAVAAWRLPTARQALALHETEAWRTRLVDSDTALTEWLDQFPGQDVQTLRNLIRNARKEAQQATEAQPHDGAPERKGRSFRDLFQHVKAVLEQAQEAEADETGEDPKTDD